MRLCRLKCDGPGCRAASPWELLPDGIFPTAKGWLLAKHAQLCPACLKKFAKGIAKDRAVDLSERVIEKRQGLGGSLIRD